MKILSPFGFDGKIDFEKMTLTDVAIVIGLLALSTWIMITLVGFLLNHAAALVTLVLGFLAGRWWDRRDT